MKSKLIHIHLKIPIRFRAVYGSNHASSQDSRAGRIKMSHSVHDMYTLLGQLQERQQELLTKLGDKCPAKGTINEDEVEYADLVNKIFVIKQELLKRKPPNIQQD